MAELTKITDAIQNSDYSNSSELFQDSRFAESFGKTMAEIRLIHLDEVFLSEKFEQDPKHFSRLDWLPEEGISDYNETPFEECRPLPNAWP